MAAILATLKYQSYQRFQQAIHDNGRYHVGPVEYNHLADNSEFFTEVHRRTLDRSCQYAVFPADGRFVLQAPIMSSGATGQAINCR